MELLNEVIGAINEVLWSYILIIMLLGCAIWFTLRGKFVQFRMIGEMVRLLGDSTQKAAGGEKHISSFQAFAVSLASRVGTGNLAGLSWWAAREPFSGCGSLPCLVPRVLSWNRLWRNYIR